MEKVKIIAHLLLTFLTIRKTLFHVSVIFQTSANVQIFKITLFISWENLCIEANCLDRKNKMINTLRVSDVAQELGLSSQTIYKWHQKGDFVPMFKIGGTYRIDEDKYAQWKQDRIPSSDSQGEE